MKAVAKPVCKVETIWLREYAATFLPSEVGFRYQPEMFRAEGISVVDIRNVFRNGVDTYADKLDGPGAVWVIEGDDGDGGAIVSEIVVISEALEVTVRRAARVAKVREETNNAA